MNRLAALCVAVASFGSWVGCKKSEGLKSNDDKGSGSAEQNVVRPSQQPLAQLPPLKLADDPKRAQKVALGHVLFFDKRLSGANDRTCYSCHKNEDGNGGHDPIAIGSGDKPLTRHSPVIWNVGYWDNAFYWDGRAPSLEANVKGAWGGPNMNAGADNLDKKAAD